MNMETGSALMRRATIEDIVDGRNKTLEAYRQAHAALIAANNAVGDARKLLNATLPGRESSYNVHLSGDKASLHVCGKMPDLADYMKLAHRIVDTEVWSWVIEHTDLERLMDKKAKDEMRQALMGDPPECTVDNICATLERFMIDADMIFKRGIANVFSSLDRRFRSHDGWKIGSRVILSYAFDEYGGWNYGRNHQDSMIDIERVFRVLDDNKAGYCELVSMLQNARRFGSGPRQTEFESTYFKVRAFKNGNAHLWFTRDDLLEKVNKLLGDYYAHPIPTDRDHPAEEAKADLFKAKIVPAKNFGLFPTPPEATSRLIDGMSFLAPKNGERLRVLEPSAGTGNLARAVLAKISDKDWPAHMKKDYRFDATVDCVEIQPHLATALRNERRYAKVFNVDFITLDPATTGLYDRIVMNPPFDRERDIDHVVHAMKFLKPDGGLCAIMSAGTEFRETKKSIAVRAMIEQLNGMYKDLPPCSFVEAGTNCNTIILRVWNNGHRPSF